MLNLVWPIFIIISIIFSFFNGNIEGINKSIFASIEDAISLSITLLGTICFWNGLMEIANHTSVNYKIKKLLNPFMKKLFPKIKKEDQEYNEITMNIIANVLGLGNASTPLGIKTMKTMQEKNKRKDTLTDEMATFIVLNTASIQLIPTTVIAIRTSLGSENPTKILLPIWIATICAATAGIIATKIFIKRGK